MFLLKMKVTKYCKDCLIRIAEKTCLLSNGDRNLLNECFMVVEKLWNQGATPPAIANKIFKLIKDKTGVTDPYIEKKDKEVAIAKKTIEKLNHLFLDDLEGVLKFSAIGNSTDTFLESDTGIIDLDNISFYGDLNGIKKELMKTDRELLILGDNVSDFLFDIKLIHFLEKMGKEVFYAVKDAPVQNDLCMGDVFKYKFDKIFGNIISTGVDKVGIEKDDLKGKIKDIWEGNNTVIAKGMGNYETISEFNDGKTIIHIMKVKCHAVSEAISYPEGTYVAIVR